MGNNLSEHFLFDIVNDETKRMQMHWPIFRLIGHLDCDVMLQRGLRPTHENSLKIKRKKGIRWMPWHQEAMKDVALCDKFRGDESNL